MASALRIAGPDRLGNGNPWVLLPNAPQRLEKLVVTDRAANRIRYATTRRITGVCGVAFGVYYYFSLKKMPTTDEGTAATQAISLTGVRSDLLQIAQAERGNIALNSKCVSLDELISSGALTVSRKERDGYTYK